jgi:hypothetical protein
MLLLAGFFVNKNARRTPGGVASAAPTMGDAEAAVATYDRALALAPRHAEIHASRGNALFELGRIEAGPLFDQERFRRHLEAAYETIWSLWQRGRARGASASGRRPRRGSRPGGRE